MYKVPGTGAVAAGSGAGTLAATGANVGWWIALGATLVVLGTIAVIAAYRRSRRLAQKRK